METIEDVIIVGAGLCGLATALGLHRKGVKSVVLESSEVLRAAGFAFSTWTNAWKALEALGIADELRRHHLRLEGLSIYSASAGSITYQMPFKASEGPEMRCVRRDLLLETLAKELPSDTIRYSSKVVLIEESGNLKVLHLADGSTMKTKVLIGCDGVNSVVSKWLGLKKPSFAGRSATRGFTEFPDGHGFSPEFVQFFGQGFRAGILPCDEKSMYWYFTWSSSSKGKLYSTYLSIDTHITHDVVYFSFLYFKIFDMIYILPFFFSFLFFSFLQQDIPPLDKCPMSMERKKIVIFISNPCVTKRRRYASRQN
ncbi:putative FAD-dependent urate hydroxylase [Dioscorea sansibarensis]